MVVCNWEINKEISREVLGVGLSGFGVKWTEFDNKDQLVTKQKFFKTEKALYRFCTKLSEKPNFSGFEAWTATGFHD